MALLSISNLEKSFGPRTILDGLSLSIERGDRLGLIGRNGCGKTTLLSIITGREEPDRGELHFARDMKLVWMEQAPALDPGKTVREEARSALADLEILEAKLAEWHHKIASAPDHHLSAAEHEAFARDEAAFAALAGEDRERLLGIALEKLGLSKLYAGGYSDARAEREDEMQPDAEAEAAARQREREGSRQAKESAPRAKPKKINEFKLNAIETEIAELEARREVLNTSLADERIFRDGNKMREVATELDELEKRLVKLNADWEAIIDAAG